MRITNILSKVSINAADLWFYLRYGTGRKSAENNSAKIHPEKFGLEFLAEKIDQWEFRA